MKTIEAHIPERTQKLSRGTKTFPAYTAVFNQDSKGRWEDAYGSLLEEDVIQVCKRATNWKEIRAKHFPMEGFHS